MNNVIIPIQLFNTKNKQPNFSQYKFNYMYQDFVNKPELAFWTSPLKEKYNFPVSPWINWCVHAEFRIYKYSFILYPKPHLKIYTINSLEDIKKLPLIRQDGYCYINFEELSKSYDGLYVTADAIHQLNCVSLKEGLFLLNSWDVESICWFNSNWIERFELITNYRSKLFNILKKQEGIEI